LVGTVASDLKAWIDRVSPGKYSSDGALPMKVLVEQTVESEFGKPSFATVQT